MLLRISLASLDGPFEELVVGGGERADDEDVPACRLSRAPPVRGGASWEIGLTLRASALPFGSLPGSVWVPRRGEAVERSFAWAARREADPPLDW